MKKHHRDKAVGRWAAEKLDALEAYLKFYGTALKNQPFKRVYIDAFAGASVSKIHDPAKASTTPMPLLVEVEEQEAQEEFILGSPLRALQVENRFDHCYFFDLDETRADKLHEITEDRDDVTVRVGDCNPLIVDLAPSLKKGNIRGVAFLDPYGAHLKWSTLEALADTKKMEAVINFPLAMAINRLILRSGDMPASWKSQLTACFGTDEWYDVSYSQRDTLFGEALTVKNRDVSKLLLDLYIGRLRKLFPYVAKPRLIRNTRATPLYYLIWAGPNPLGLKGAEHILRQGEAA